MTSGAMQRAATYTAPRPFLARRGPAEAVTRRVKRSEPVQQRRCDARPDAPAFLHHLDPFQGLGQRGEKAAERAGEPPPLHVGRGGGLRGAGIEGTAISGLQAEEAVRQGLLDGAAAPFEPSVRNTGEGMEPGRQRGDRRPKTPDRTRGAPRLRAGPGSGGTRPPWPRPAPRRDGTGDGSRCRNPRHAGASPGPGRASRPS